jgi:Transglutaminase-like superfamily
MPDLITSVGPFKSFPYLSTLGCPGKPCGAGNKSCGPGQIRNVQTQAMIGKSRPYLVQQRTPLNSTRVRIGSGDRGISQTIRYMYGAVMGNEGVASAEIRRQALTIVQCVPSRDQQGEIAAVLQWVKTNIAFRGEYAETVQTPLVTLQLRAGDCDDQSTLMAALLGSLGYKTRFKTVAADPSAPYAFSHVYIEVFHRKSGQWISLDSTVQQSYPGWQAPRIFRSKAWRTMGDPPDTVATPSASASTGPVSKTQAILQLLQPLSQGVADRIRYGGNPPKTANLNFGLNTSSLTAGGISPTWVIAGGAVTLGLVLALAFKGGRV